MTKKKRNLIRLVIIQFDISRAIQSHQSQGEPIRVRNGHQEPDRAIESKPEPVSHPDSISNVANDQAKEDTFYVSQYIIWPKWISKTGYYIRLVIISFDHYVAIQSHQSQGKPTRVGNGHQEPARANETKLMPPI
jgi:hypothetical protein